MLLSIEVGRAKVRTITTMPRTLEEILANTDELADRFECYELSADDELDVAAAR